METTIALLHCLLECLGFQFRPESWHLTAPRMATLVHVECHKAHVKSTSHPQQSMHAATLPCDSPKSRKFLLSIVQLAVIDHLAYQKCCINGTADISAMALCELRHPDANEVMPRRPGRCSARSNQHMQATSTALLCGSACPCNRSGFCLDTGSCSF